MVQLILIGLSAGAATALLFASVASGSALSVPLFYLAPLPILIAAIGWSHWAALIAAVLASAVIASIFSGFMFLAFLVGIALPAWWLGYLALLARPVPDAPGGLEWYPEGSLVFWAAVIAAAIVIGGILAVGGDLDGFRAAMRTSLEKMLRVPAPTEPAPGADTSTSMTRVIDFMVVMLPPAMAVLNTLTSVINLWLATRIVAVSGRLRRPVADLATLRFPSYATAALAAAFAATFLPGLAGVSAGVLTASLVTAYGLLGLATLHFITRGVRIRPFLLGTAYASMLVLGWPVLLFAVLGLADAATNLRGRAAAKRNRPRSTI